MIHLRDRELGIRERLRLGEQLANFTRDYDQSLCVNDRLDLAVLLEAQALHLGENSVGAREVRQQVGDRFWLTRASHDPLKSDAQGADAVLLSPICGARKGVAAKGLSAITEACATSSVPIYALGGISPDNAAACLLAGATGVAAIGAWLAIDSVERIIHALNIAKSAT